QFVLHFWSATMVIAGTLRFEAKGKVSLQWRSEHHHQQHHQLQPFNKQWSRGGDDIGGVHGWLEITMAVGVVVVMTWVARGVGEVVVGGVGEVVVGGDAEVVVG
ncbi:hypothetical protein Tco_1581356, partial [Tanacetum coccineum]